MTYMDNIKTGLNSFRPSTDVRPSPMKIGLIYPSRSRKKTYSCAYPPLQGFFETNPYVPSFILPSLSLLTIASCTPSKEHVRLIDERISPIDFDEPFDIVGISIMTEQARRGYEIAEEFRKRGIFTVIGGIHASVLPRETKRHCDAVIIGEGESSWPELLRDFGQGTPRAFYRASDPLDLRTSPVPRYELVDINAYPFLPLQTTRGCPLDCSFCSATKVFGRSFRTKSIRQIVGEIEALLRVSRNRKVVFNDDNMFMNRKESYELLKAIIPLRIKYFVEADVSIAEDERLLDLMAKSGCVTVFIGFESLISDNLDAIQRTKWKRRRLERYAEACAKIQAKGIQVLGAFILGFDHDDAGVFRRTADFVLENNILAQFHVLTPFPGTRIRDELVAEGRLLRGDDRWDLYSCFDVVFSPKLLSKSELEEGLLDVYSSVYTKNAYTKRSRHMVEMFKRLRQTREAEPPQA